MALGGNGLRCTGDVDMGEGSLQLMFRCSARDNPGGIRSGRTDLPSLLASVACGVACFCYCCVFFWFWYLSYTCITE